MCLHVVLPLKPNARSPGARIVHFTSSMEQSQFDATEEKIERTSPLKNLKPPI